MEKSLDNPSNPFSIESHALLSCLKAISSAQAQLRIQHLRELMGGHGYSLFSLVGVLRSNNDMNVTM